MSLQATERELLALLSDPATYRLTGEKVVHRETHGAHVFLAGNHAWKIKRHVKYAYMDFSTPDKRHQALQRELELNRRQAPEIYLGLTPITRQPDRTLHLDGDGEPVEWALLMRRFDEGQLLSGLAAAGPIEPELAKSLADVIWEYHHDAPRIEAPDAGSRIARVLEALLESLQSSDAVLPNHTVACFRSRALNALDDARDTLDRRGAAGFVRRCHGDLHMSNVVVFEGRPLLFDALEFDENLATIDTLYDLAFLLMDLERAGRRESANQVLNRYLWRTGELLDLEGLAALPLFMAMRAGVRALVTAQHSRQAGQDAHYETERADASAARSYLDLGVQLLATLRPCLVAIGGLSGTGKSRLSATLAPGIGVAPGALHLRSDLERKSMFHVEETTRLSKENYSPEVNANVYGRLGIKAHTALSAGHSIIVDAVFAEPSEREAIGEVANATGAAFVGLWLEAPAGVLLERVSARRGDASDADAGVVTSQLIRDLGPMTWTSINAAGTPEMTLDYARAALAEALPGP